MSDPTKILLIEDDADCERLVKAVFAQSDDGIEVRAAQTLAQGLLAIERFKPDVVLVDLDLPDSRGYPTFLRVQEQSAGIPIIVLTALDDDETALKAVKDGAQDYLVKSLIQPKLITRSMRMALHRLERETGRKELQSSTRGIVLGFIGGKGGVGTSTTAVNIAAVLVQNGWNTILAELQPGPGSLSVYVQSEPALGIQGLLEKPSDAITGSDIENHLLEAVRGLRLLCPAAGPAVRNPIGAAYIEAIVCAARKVSPYLVLDLPAQIDEGTTAALKLCDGIALIVDREPSAVRCAAAVLQQIEAAVCPALNVRRVVVERTLLDEPLRMTDLQHQLKVQTTVVVPHAASAIARSHWVRTPLMFLHPDELFRLAHLELAQSLLAPYTSSHGLLGGDDKQAPWRSRRRTVPEIAYS